MTEATTQTASASLVSPSPTGDPAPAAASAEPVVAAAATPVEAPAVERPSYVPEAFWDADAKSVKVDDFAKHLETLSTTQAELEAKRAKVPESADKYELKLPEGIELPEGMGLDENDPRLPIARELAKDLGLSQDDFSKLIAMDIQRELKSAEAVNAMKARETQRLGDNSTARLDAVAAFIDGMAPNADVSKSVKNMLISADSVEFFENVSKALRSQGIDPLTHGGNATQHGMSEENWAAMTPSQRLATTWKPAARG